MTTPMTAETLLPVREAFEKWVAQRWALVKDKPDLRGVNNQWTGDWHYTMSQTSDLFQAWLAAWNTRPAPSGSEDLVERMRQGIIALWEAKEIEFTDADLPSAEEMQAALAIAKPAIEAPLLAEIETLRERGVKDAQIIHNYSDTMHKLIAQITTLSQQVERMREALKPFAMFANSLEALQVMDGEKPLTATACVTSVSGNGYSDYLWWEYFVIARQALTDAATTRKEGV